MTQERIDWLKGRQKGIGGSDVAAIFGLSRYRTPLDVYFSKTEEEVDDSQSQAAYWGSQLEDLVAKEFQKRTGMKVQRVNKQLVNPKEPWMMANIDRAVVNPEISGNVRVLDEAKQAETGRMLTTDAILECKTASAFIAGAWGDTQEYEIIRGEIVTEHVIPEYYETQVQWYMGITGAKICYVAALLGGQDFRIYAVPRNDELISVLQDKCREFWTTYVVPRVTPDPVTIADAYKLWPRDTDGMVEASPDDAVNIGEILNIDAQIKELTEQKEELKTKLIISLKDAQGFLINGKKALSYKAQSTTRIDSTRLKKESPETYLQFCKTSESRTFRLAY